MKQADYINNQSRQKLEKAEKELMNGNVSGAKKIRKQVQKDAQLYRIKEFIKKILQDQEIRDMIRDLLSELSPI
jgi:hypothetical protein